MFSAAGVDVSKLIAELPDSATEGIPAMLKCGICMEPSTDWVNVCSNRHSCCRGCGDAHKAACDRGSTGRKCPFCRDRMSEFSSNRDKNEMTIEYRIVCTQGCGESLRLIDLTKHIKEKCPCVPVKCPFHEYGCSFSGTRGEMEQHLKDNSHGEFAMGIFKSTASAIDGQKQEVVNSMGEFKTLIESLVSTVDELKTKIEAQESRIFTLSRLIDDSERNRRQNHDQYKESMASFKESADALALLVQETKDQTKKRARPGEGESSRTKYRNQQVARLKAKNKELSDQLDSFMDSTTPAVGRNNAEAGSSSDPVNVEADGPEPGPSADASADAEPASSSAANPLVVDVEAAAAVATAPNAGKQVPYQPSSPAYSPTSPSYSPTSPAYDPDEEHD